MKIDRDTDELLWAAAESPDDSVREQFAKRYPHLRAELATRRTMVQVLRQSKPNANLNLAERYLPSARNERRAFPRLAWIGAGSVLLVGLAFGSFAVVRYFGVKPREEKSVVSAPLPAPELKPRPVIEASDSGEMKSIVPPVNERGTAPRPDESNPANKPIELPTKSLRLMRALDLISKQSGLAFTVLPDVKDQALELGDAGALGPTVTLSLQEAVDLIERCASVRILDNGTEGYLVLPMDKVTNAPDTSANESGGMPSVSRGG